MDKLVHAHHFTQQQYVHNPLVRKLSRSHTPTSLVVGDMAAIPEIPLTTVASSSSSLNLPSDFHSLNNLPKVRTLSSVKELHASMFKMHDKANWDAIDDSLITNYLEFGDFGYASRVFFVGFAPNCRKWTSFLDEFQFFGGDPVEILATFKELYRKGVNFDCNFITVVLKLCSSLMDSWLGLEIHACLIKKGFGLDVHLNCALINFYGNCWDIDRANRVFEEIQYHEDFLWNTIIMVNLKKERWMTAVELFRCMQFSFCKATGGTIVKVLQACRKLGALGEGKQIHGHVLRYALESNTSICNSLITMYSKNGKHELARAVFDSMQDHILSSWNSIISCYASLGRFNHAWDMFQKMDSANVKPDIITWNCLLAGHCLHGSYKAVLTILRRMQIAGIRPESASVTSVLPAVAELGLVNFGKEIHGYVIRNSLDYDVYVGTSLVDMYAKNESLSNAQKVFDNMMNKNTVAWNSLISGYSFKGMFQDAEVLLNRMNEEGNIPDLMTWNGLLSGYSMSGCIEEALSVIQRMKTSGLTPNIISWTALISGCSQNEKYKDGFKFFRKMQAENVRANSTTMCSLLKSCAGLSLLKRGKEIHSRCIRLHYSDDIYVATTLIDMYSKSGSLINAENVFSEIQDKTLASWNCMIMAYAMYFQGKQAIALFQEMCRRGIRPDGITFTSLLSACKNSCLMDEGWKYFDSMKTDYNIDMRIEHYSCMVDLLGRAGYLDEAWDFIQSIPLKPDASIWGALLASCRIHRDLNLAEIAKAKLFELEPHNAANYVLMMNIYSICSKWEKVDHLRDLMTVRKIKISHIWSWTQIDQKVHVFSTEGKAHPDEGEIYYELYHLISEIKRFGYVPDINCVYQNIEESEKQKVLLSHPEKLAITYSLIKTKRSQPIRVIKNTRVCQDCHTAAKYISLARSREIILRDGVRFHHFTEGKCSCNDIW